MVPLQMWFKETRALIGRGLNCIFPHSTSAPFPSNYDTTKHIFKIIFRKQPLFLQAKETGKVQLKSFHGYWSYQKLSSYQFVKFNLLRNEGWGNISCKLLIMKTSEKSQNYISKWVGALFDGVS